MGIRLERLPLNKAKRLVQIVDEEKNLPRLAIRPKTYRDKAGYTVSGQDREGRKISIFTPYYTRADRIKHLYYSDKNDDEINMEVDKILQEPRIDLGKNKVEEGYYPKIVKDGLVKSPSWVWNHASEEDKKEFEKHLIDIRDPLSYANISRYHKYTTYMGKAPQVGKKKEMFSVVPLQLGTSKWV